MSYYTIDFGVNFANARRYNPDRLKHIMATSWEEGVDKVVSISNSRRESEVNVRLSREYENLHYTLGIHPHNAKDFREEDMRFIESNLSDPKCFGVGECGLDFNRNFSSKEDQVRVFEAQVQLAKRTNTNLYLHCRDAYEEFMSVIRRHGHMKGIVHCFTGTYDQARELISLGFKLGITGCLFDRRRNAELISLVSDKSLPLEAFIVETDAPFINYYKNGRRESLPTDTAYVVEEIARLREMDVIACGQALYNAAKTFLSE